MVFSHAIDAERSRERSERRRALIRCGLAATLSAAVPGLGQLLQDRWRRGFFFIGTVGVVLVAAFGSYWLGGLAWPLFAAHGVLGVATVTAALDALFARRAAREKAVSLRARAVLLIPSIIIWLLLGFAPLRVLALAQGIRWFSVPSASMEPTILHDEWILVEMSYWRSRPVTQGELLVFQQPDGLWLVKRVIALGGQTIEGRDGRVFVDGKRLDEPYVRRDFPPSSAATFGPVQVPEGQLFVMGDSRDRSYDSRFPAYPPVDLDGDYGRAVCIFWSSDRGRMFRALK